MRPLALTALLLSSAAAQQPTPPQQPHPIEPALTIAPTEANFAAWRAHIEPCDDELLWEQIPWHSTFADGLRAADQQQKPLLFWAMNGHPLGCT